MFQILQSPGHLGSHGNGAMRFSYAKFVIFVEDSMCLLLRGLRTASTKASMEGKGPHGGRAVVGSKSGEA